MIVPRANVRSLMLRDAVVAAAREGAFHVWAIDSVDEGIELLTGHRCFPASGSGT